MTPETINQIQKLIGLAVSLLALIGLTIMLLSFVIEYYVVFLKSREIVHRDEEIKKLKKQLDNKTEWEKLRYEHEILLKEYMKKKEENK